MKRGQRVPGERRIRLVVPELKTNFTIAYRYRKGKSGLNLLFIHGLGAANEHMKGVWTAQGYEQHSILTIDLPGFGGSSKPTNFSYDMSDQALVVHRLLQKLRLNKVHIIGHSLGGAVGVLLCLKYPKGIRSLINLEGNLTNGDCDWSRRIANQSWQRWRKSGYSQMTRAFSKGELLSHSWGQMTPNAIYKSSVSLVQWSDSGKLLKNFLKLKIKKHYIYGSKNRTILTARLLRKNRIPMTEISKSGHCMMLDNPQEFYQKLLTLL